jgi:hypothetical protein
MGRLLESKWFWAAVFATLFVLSIDFWAWGWVEPSLFGLPYTIIYIIVLESLLFVAFIGFAKYYWKDDGEGA